MALKYPSHVHTDIPVYKAPPGWLSGEHVQLMTWWL